MYIRDVCKVRSKKQDDGQSITHSIMLVILIFFYRVAQTLLIYVDKEKNSKIMGEMKYTIATAR